MSIFSSMFKARDKPKDSTAGLGAASASAWMFRFGGSSSNKLVTKRSSMQVAAVYACVWVLSEAVAQLPLHLYKYTGDGSKEKALDHPLYRLLHDEPNSEMSSFVYRETEMCHLLLWGNAARRHSLFRKVTIPIR